MKELVLTHNIDGIANIASVDYDKGTITIKRVPSSSPMLEALLQSGKIRKCYSELSDDSDIWLWKEIKRGWVSVSKDGFVSYTLESKRLEADDSAFLTSFVELPVWSDKSKVFVAKLIQAGQRVALRPYIKVAGRLSPEIARAFANMFATQPSESATDVSQIEIWGHTLNVLYGSNMELLDPSLLSELNWLRPLVCGDTVLWRGMTSSQDKTLYVYLKGDAVLYVGYHNLKEADSNRHTPKVTTLSEVLTYENLLSDSCVGLLDIIGTYLMFETVPRKFLICNELISKDIESKLVEFLSDSMVLMDVRWETLLNGIELQTRWLYDLVNNKIYVFKSYRTEKLGTYYGEMTVDEWRKRKDNYLGES